jgi:glutathione S-transferase
MARDLYIDRLWISPYALFAFVALKEKNLPFSVRPVALEAKEQKRPAFLALSDSGKIPCLVDEGFALSESAAIAEYLDEVYPYPVFKRLFPAEPRARAKARQIVHWLNTDFMILRQERPTSTVFYEPAARELSNEARADGDRLIDFSRKYLVDGRPHLFGDWSLADTVLAMTMMRLVKSGDAVPAWFKAYAEAQWQRPAVREFATTKRPPFVKYY